MKISDGGGLIPAIVEQERLVHLNRSVDELTAQGACVNMLGSFGVGEADVLSDTDYWITWPDDIAAQGMAARSETYDAIGSVIFSWERPKFAPIEGVHSVVFYDGITPVESNYFHCPSRSEKKHYAGIYSPETIRGVREGFDYGFPWQEGSDSVLPIEKFKYTLCVAAWANKYYARGDDSQIEWLVRKYFELPRFVEGMRLADTESLNNEDGFLVIEHVLDVLCETGEIVEGASGMAEKFLPITALGRLVRGKTLDV